MSIVKPMLAATIVDPSQLHFPCLVSPKLDGLRCLINGGAALSRNGKPFRNAHVQKVLSGLPDGLDGELIVGPPNSGHVLNRTQSGIMSSGGEPEFTYWLFDNFLDPYVFHKRWLLLADTIKHPAVQVVPHHPVNNLAELLYKEQQFLDEGYEGLMTRDMLGAYKQGRSTLLEGGLGKLKRFRDGEAMVTGLQEGVNNRNEAVLDELGRTKRSNHQENKVGSGQVGTIEAQDLKTGEPMLISPGRMTHSDRVLYWNHQYMLLGKIIKYKTFDYGALNASRFSTFQAFRSKEDMDT